jgi:hypothetical protein
MTPSTSSPSAAPLPPLPDFNSSGGGPSGSASGMSSLVAGVAPVKMGVDLILKGAQMIVQSGAVPGGEQPCAQIISLATSLLPMAAQNALNPMGGAGTPPPTPPPPPGAVGIGTGASA